MPTQTLSIVQLMHKDAEHINKRVPKGGSSRQKIYLIRLIILQILWFTKFKSHLVVLTFVSMDPLEGEKYHASDVGYHPLLTSVSSELWSH